MENSFFNKTEIEELLKQTEDLEFESYRIPKIHNQLNVLILEISKKFNRLNKNYNKLLKDKWLYYSGKASNDVYKEKPFGLKVLKTDLHLFLQSDDELSDLAIELEDLKSDQKFLEECLKQLNQRNFQHKIIIEDRKFKAGN
jgi:hypothetical protein